MTSSKTRPRHITNNHKKSIKSIKSNLAAAKQKLSNEISHASEKNRAHVYVPRRSSRVPFGMGFKLIQVARAIFFEEISSSTIGGT